MPRSISITSAGTPPILVVQRAYQEYFAGTAAQSPTVYHADAGAIGFVITVRHQISAFPTEPPAEDWLKFRRLVADWHRERGAMSSITEAAICPAYQTIMGMGPDAVPLILAQLESEGDQPDQWFWALKATTGADPVRDENRGDFVAMARSWLDWAKNEGYAW